MDSFGQGVLADFPYALLVHLRQLHLQKCRLCIFNVPRCRRGTAAAARQSSVVRGSASLTLSSFRRHGLTTSFQPPELKMATNAAIICLTTGG